MSSASDLSSSTDMNDIVQSMKARGDAFAVATVVRTVSVTAAKPGAKAIVNTDGAIVDGWIGGGCARHAVMKAAQQAIADGEPRLISLQPEDLLKEQGISSGQQTDGKLIASNMCPSRGSMDIFIEPVLSNPDLLVIGGSPVAVMLVRLAPLFDLNVCVMQSFFNTDSDLAIKHRYDEYKNIPGHHPHRYVVVATQGSGDTDALTAALALESIQLAFVGSKRKLEHLRAKLRQSGQQPELLNRIKGPAGLDIGGVTPQEIAVSILAEIIQIRRGK